MKPTTRKVISGRIEILSRELLKLDWDVQEGAFEDALEMLLLLHLSSFADKVAKFREYAATGGAKRQPREEK